MALSFAHVMRSSMNMLFTFIYFLIAREILVEWLNGHEGEHKRQVAKQRKKNRCNTRNTTIRKIVVEQINE